MKDLSSESMGKCKVFIIHQKSFPKKRGIMVNCTGPQREKNLPSSPENDFVFGGKAVSLQPEFRFGLEIHGTINDTLIGFAQQCGAIFDYPHETP